MKKYLYLCAVLFCIQSSVYATPFLRLRVPIIEDSPTLHLFFHELLEQSLKANGYVAEIQRVRVPQVRAKQDLETGRISLLWMVQTKERNEQFVPINIGLTNGLIGKRILLIRKNDQYHFDGVSSLDDFRNLGLIAGLGEKWFDVLVWEKNNLLYKENDGGWRAIFKMLAQGREYDYFPRGINEIIEESVTHQDLAIEKRLVIIYERDFQFYLSAVGEYAGARYKEAIESSLIKARKSGLLDRLIEKYWGNNLKLLNYDQRIQLYLNTPD